MHMRYWSKSFWVLLVVSLVSLTGQATELQPGAPTCPVRPIVVGVYEYGQFYHAGAGLDLDVVDQLQARSGCKFIVQQMARGTIWQAMQAGSVDMTLSAVATPGRLVFSWAIPYVWFKNVVVLNKSVDPNVKSIADFIATPNLHLGVVRSFDYSTDYDGFVSQLRNIGRVDEIGETDRLFAMLDANRFQAVVAPTMVYPTYIKSGGYRIEDWSAAIPRVAGHIMISKKNFNQAEMKKWADLVTGVINDGTMRRLLEKYVSSDEVERILWVGQSH